MSHAAVDSVERSIGSVKDVISSLTDEEWMMPSGCAGWTVRDLVAHMSSNYHEMVSPSPKPDKPVDLPAERRMDLLVDARSDWSNEQIRDEYLADADGALAALRAMQDEPMASTVIPLADLGSYPMHQLADAYAFDHYCHLYIDLLAPTGPIERTVEPADDTLLGPAIGWMMAGLPQMQPGLGDYLHGRVRLVLTGAGGGTWDLVPDNGEIAVGAPHGTPDATVTSTAHDFVSWGTTRTPWRDHTTIEGDQTIAAQFLDALNII